MYERVGVNKVGSYVSTNILRANDTSTFWGRLGHKKEEEEEKEKKKKPCFRKDLPGSIFQYFFFFYGKWPPKYKQKQK